MMASNRILLTSSVIALFSFARPAAAQDGTTDGEPQEEIADCFDFCGPLVVDGQPARIPSALTISRSVSVSDGQAMENALRNVPGLQQFRRTDSRSANPSGQGITMRGLGGNASSRALVMLDGVPQMDPFGGWVSWTGLDATAATSALVTSGGGHVKNGGGAIAGLVELYSERANYGSYGNRFGFDVQGGSFGSVGARSSGLVDVGGVIAQFSGAAERSDGFAPIIAPQRGAVDGRAAYSNHGGALRLLKALTGDIELQANVRSWTDKRNRGTPFSENRNGGTDASLRVVGSGHVDWTVLGYFQDRDFSSQFAAISADRKVATPTLDQYAVPAKGWGASAALGFDAFTNWQLSMGADWRRVEGETRENFFFTANIPGRNRRAGGESETVGAFAEILGHPIDRLQASLSARMDRWTITNGFRREINIGGSVRSDDRFANRRGAEPTARAAFDWRFRDAGVNDSAHLKGSLFTSWRLPTLNELYRPFRVGNDATAANEALEPERVRGAELGLSWAKDGYNFSLTGFTNRLRNAIANVTLGQGPGTFPGVGVIAAGGVYRKRQNLDAISSKGFELEADGWLTGNLRFEAGYAFVDAKVRSSGSAATLDGLRPAQVPHHFGRLSLLFDALAGGSSIASEAFIGSGITIRYSGAQFEDDANRLRLDKALTIDALLKYRLTKGITLRVSAENIFDEQVMAAVNSAGIIERANPRTLSLGVKFDID